MDVAIGGRGGIRGGSCCRGRWRGRILFVLELSHGLDSEGLEHFSIEEVEVALGELFQILARVLFANLSEREG